MNNQPIICTGSDLAHVLSDIRAKGGFVASLETKVGKLNAQYRVNYFAKTETSLPVTSPPIDETGKSPEGPGRDENKPLMRNRTAYDVPSPTGNTGGDNFGSGPDKAGTGSSRTPLGQLTAATPTNLERVENQASQVESLTKPLKVRVQVPAALNQFPVPVLAEPCKTVPHEDGPKCIEARGGIRSCVTDTLAAGNISIEERMSALQSKLASSGKLKRKQPREARMPYSDHD